jgi:hypothetical protein
MTIEEAKLQVDKIEERGEYFDIPSWRGRQLATLDGHFTADDLEAIAIVMRATFNDTTDG